MDAVLTKIKSGIKLLLLVTVLQLVTGCQIHVLIDLLNESGQDIQVEDYPHGRLILRTVRDHGRISVLSPEPLVLHSREKEIRYNFQSVPKDAVHPRFVAHVISVELRPDGKLYLLTQGSGRNQPSLLMNPQPIPFPITPSN